MSEQAYKKPLIDLLQSVPKDHRTQWPIQWSGDGWVSGHAMCPVGILAHEAADRIVELEAALASIEGESVGETHNKEVVICNHGKVFGNYDWYTFHCPACNAQVSNREDCKCGQQLQWPEVSDE
jgi:hypothetical protein